MTGLFLYLFVLNFIQAVMAFTLIYFLVIRFGEKAVDKKKMTGLFTSTSMIIAFINTALTAFQIQMNGHFIFSFGMLFYFTLVILAETFVVKRVISGIPSSFIFLVVTIIDALSNLGNIFTENSAVYIKAMKSAATYLEKFGLRMPFLIISFVTIYGIIRLFQKSRLLHMVKAMMNRSRACICIGTIMILLNSLGLHIYSNELEAFGIYYHNRFYILFFMCVAAVIILLLYSYLSDLKRNEMKMVITQQGEYLKRLEEIQKKLRVINHDYKNVAAGLYLTAEAGNVDEVKNYINNQLLKLDHEIQQEISQMNQLINLQDIELKSLFITKAAYAAAKGVDFSIEISNFVAHIKVPVSDLLRSIGILMDNAIEGAGETKEKLVKVLLMEENQMVTILIKNSLDKKLSLSQIFHPEYTSKGEGRGLGLYSLKEILKKYPNIFLETHLERGWFIQIIKIK